ncbi:MAG: NHL repeat-containing protein [Planctomycetota bacterium]|jgi:hypothetical protein
MIKSKGIQKIRVKVAATTTDCAILKITGYDTINDCLEGTYVSTGTERDSLDAFALVICLENGTKSITSGNIYYGYFHRGIVHIQVTHLYPGGGDNQLCVCDRKDHFGSVAPSGFWTHIVGYNVNTMEQVISDHIDDDVRGLDISDWPHIYYASNGYFNRARAHAVGGYRCIDYISSDIQQTEIFYRPQAIAQFKTIWRKTTSALICDIRRTGTGNIVVAGYKYKPDGVNWANVAQYDSDGVLDWYYRLDDDNNADYAYDLAIDSNNDVIVASEYWRTGGSEGEITKIDNTGSLDWVAGASGALDTQIGRGVAVDSSDDVFAAFALVGAENDTQLRKYDGTNGALVWEYQTGVNDGDDLYSVDVDSSNNVVCGGASTEDEDSDTASVRKINGSTGAKIWEYNTSSTVLCVKFDGDGNVWAGDNAGHLFKINGSTGALISDTTISTLVDIYRIRFKENLIVLALG